MITDPVYGFAVLAASGKPKTFVIPSGPDFTALINEPSLGAFGTCCPSFDGAGCPTR